MIKFTVLGEPQGKGRPRFSVIAGHVHARTPEQTATYENLIRVEYLAQCGANSRFADDEMLKMQIDAYYSIPKSDSAKKRAQKLNGEIRPTKKPDMDNVLKVYADALNGYAYRDDTQIVEAVVNKWYSEVPRVDVEVREI